MAKAKKQKGEAGRPAILEVDPAVARAIAAAVERCYYIAPAAAACGIEPRTAQDWMERGARESSGIYANFAQMVKKARAKWEVERIESIRDHGKKSWQAQAWLLERMASGYRLTDPANESEDRKATAINFIDASESGK